MKRKFYLALIAGAMIFAAAGCGEKGGTDTNTETAADKGGDAEEGKDSTEDTKDNGEDTDSAEEGKGDNKPESFGTRIVSVENVDKYVTIGEYKGLTLDRTVEEVTDEQVEAQIDYVLENNKEEVKDKEAVIQEGDLATINFVGTMDGETFDGGTANNYDLTIGEGGMIPGFEEGIIGMKTGETKDVNVTFPEDYVEDMAGKDAVFKITVQKFRRTPQLTDEWVAANSEVKTVDEYKEYMRTQLTETAQSNADTSIRQTAWEALNSSSEVKEYPQEDIENAVTEFRSLYEQYAAQAGQELEDFVESQGITMEYFEEQANQYAESKVKQNLIIQGIMDAEGMSLDDEECLAIQDEMIAQYGAKDLADLIDTYGQVAVDESIGLIRVENFIIENAQVNELVSNGELVGANGGAAEE